MVKDDGGGEDIVEDCFIKIWDSGTQFPMWLGWLVICTGWLKHGGGKFGSRKRELKWLI